MDTLDPAAYPDLLRTVAFAARAHRHQLRKDGETPYVSHVFRVALTVSAVFGVSEVHVLQAAVLHDTIEDTNTDYDDLEREFGKQVADWVAALTKEKSLPEPAREEAYRRNLAAASWEVQLCKLADVFDNLQDAHTVRTKQPAKTLQRSREYLAVLNSPDPRVQRAKAIVERLLIELNRGA